jgi:PhnB protein
MQVQPYLFFEGRCEEAMDFYRRALGAQVTSLMRYRESPEPATVPPGSGDKIMHLSVRIGETTLLASDGHCSGNLNFAGFSLTLTTPDESEAQRLFAGLCDGGEVRVPLAKTFFSSLFGMVTDRFGLLWIIYVAPAGG